MGFLTSLAPRRNEPELMDRPSIDPDDLRAGLMGIERLNRLFGGTALIVSELHRLVKRRRLSGTVSILDAGTGGADIPRALVRSAHKRGVRVKIVACDRHQQILDAAAAFSSEFPQISFVRDDILRESSFPPASFDFAICSLMAHHLSAKQTILLFKRLERVSRHGFVLSDLERSRWACAGVWLGTRLFSRSRLARNDGPLSVLRSYTLEELTELARRAGLRGLHIFRYPLFRIAVVQEKDTLEP